MAKSKTAKTPKAREFKAEVAKLLHLMVHSVYSEREVFLRELISNAADACDKLRYEAIARPELMSKGGDLQISLRVDKDAKRLEVYDSGIGMSADELVDNLGTIARSGTQAFMDEAAKAKGDDAVQLIGQFGVGFYSAFMVASSVDVISRDAASGDVNIWSSDGTGTFSITPYDGDDAPERGTIIRLSVRDDAAEFLETHRIEHIVRTYSDHIAHPIMLDVAEDVPRQINSAAAIWSRPKSEITEEQYKEFFGHVSGSFGDPALTLHYRAEGRNEYSVLLFVPGEQPFDLFDQERKGRQKLYVRRVFITADAEVLPPYLRFVRGVIDSQDMPLNISREMLQHNPTVAAIRKAVTNRVLSELKKCAEKDPEIFTKIWDAFGAVIKEGLYEDMERRDQLFELVRFASSQKDDPVTLKDYVDGMVENQTAIYYVTGDDAAKIKASPQLEGFSARGINVLLLSDPIDSFWVRTAMGFDGKPFKSVTQGAADLDAIPVADKKQEDGADQETDKTAIATLIAAMKQALGERVEDVRTSDRLTSSPVCLVANDSGLDRTLEKLLARQGDGDRTMSAPILEINPEHSLITALAVRAKTDADSVGEAAELLLDQAHVLEGEPPADAAAFARRLTSVMSRVFAG